jgi:hypothetical protein
VRGRLPKLKTLIMVEWWDTVTEATPSDVEKALYPRTSVGWLVYVGPCSKSGLPVITIAGTKDMDDEWADQTVMPRGWVKSIRELPARYQ